MLSLATDRKFNRLCEPKAASGREASEGQRAGQGATESAANISEVSERASAGFGRRLQAQRAGVRSGAAAPSVAEDGGYQETRWSNSKSGSGWAMRSQSRHRLEIIVPAGRSAGGGDRRWLGGLADMGKDALHRGGLGDEGDDAHVCAAVGADQRQGLEQPRQQQGPEIARRRSHVAQRSSGRWVRLGGGAQVVSRIAPEGDGRCTQGRVGREHAVVAMAVAPGRR